MGAVDVVRLRGRVARLTSEVSDAVEDETQASDLVKFSAFADDNL
jgi:hypothetical protein